jgi:3-oxoacyl-[acyl-carrier protein] reductase
MTAAAARPPILLSGRRVLVTGVSRPLGIGFSLARACAVAGASVLVHGLSAYDRELGYSDAGTASPESLAQRLRDEGLDVRSLASVNLADAAAPSRLFDEIDAHGVVLDGLVLNHACSIATPLGQWTAEHVDRHFAVNVRASMLLLQEFAARLPKDRGGAVVLMTSGQYLGPMVEEIAYAASKEAIRGLAVQAAAALAPRGVRVNSVNPGPTDTGYLEGDAYDRVRQMFPAGRWGTPDDVARLVTFLLSDEARWITGQTVASEGGFRR